MDESRESGDGLRQQTAEVAFLTTSRGVRFFKSRHEGRKKFWVRRYVTENIEALGAVGAKNHLSLSTREARFDPIASPAAAAQNPRSGQRM